MNKEKIIDIQSHYLPEKWICEMEKRNDYPFLQKKDEENWVINGSSFDKLPYQVSRGAIDIRAKLKEMDNNGIIRTLITLSPPGPDCACKPEDATYLAEIANAGIAEVVNTYPTRFSGVANLGYGNIEDSMAELQKCIEEFHFVGLQLYPYAQGIGIEDSSFRPVFKYMYDKDLPIIMHPGSPVNKDYQTYKTGPLLGYWFDDALAILKLILSGLFDEFPGIKIVCPHVWSVMPFVIDRLNMQVNSAPQFFSNSVKKSLKEYMNMVYTDSNQFSTDTLDFAIKKMGGVEKMMFGSDSPFVNPQFIVQLINGLNISKEDKEKIFYKNAINFFNLEE